MQLQLSQQEIKAAVRSFVTDDLGINLAGKTLDVAFTAGRGATGITATLTIEQAGTAAVATVTDPVVIPGYSDSDADAPVTETKAAAETPAADAPAEDPAVDPADAAAAADEPEEVVEAAKPAEKKSSTSSLFAKTAD